MDLEAKVAFLEEQVRRLAGVLQLLQQENADDVKGIWEVPQHSHAGGAVRGPTGIVAEEWNTDPTKKYVKVDVSTSPPTVTELDSEPMVGGVKTWGESEMYYEKANTYGDIIITRWG